MTDDNRLLGHESEKRMSDPPQDIDELRELAARLRSLAMIEPTIADQLHQIADETDDCAEAIAARRQARGFP